MSKELGWEPGTTETSQKIREDLLRVLMQHGMATSLEDCLDFMYETMIIAGAGAFAAGLTEDQAASFFKAALEDIYQIQKNYVYPTTLLSSPRPCQAREQRHEQRLTVRQA